MSASREKRARENDNSPDLDTKIKKKSKQTGKLNDRFYSIIAVVIAAVLLVSVGFAAFQNVVASGKYFAAADVAGDKVYPHELNYYYINSYMNYVNNYGSFLQYLGLDTSKSLKAQSYSEDKTWHDYFLETAMNSVQEVKMLVREAAAAGVTLSEELKAQVEEDFRALMTSIEAQKMDLNYYLTSYYGKSMTADEFKRIMGETYLAQQYGQQVFDGFTYTDDEVKEYYNENKKNFDVVDYRNFFFSAEPDSDNPTDEEKATAKATAKSLADIMQAAVTGEQAFIDLSRKNAPEEQQTQYEDPDYTLYEGETYSSVQSLNQAMADWLFSEDRASGNTTVIEDDNGYYVVYMKARYRHDYNTANVRHILVQFETTEDQEEPTQEQIDAAKAAAQEIFDEWKAGEATEESFAELAKQRTDDGGSKENGGLYENVYKGQMVPEFENWTFDEARKPGDTGLVQTDYGFHIMYYVSSGSPFWTVQVRNTLRNTDYSDFSESLKEKYPIKSRSLGLIAVGLPNQ